MRTRRSAGLPLLLTLPRWTPKRPPRWSWLSRFVGGNGWRAPKRRVGKAVTEALGCQCLSQMLWRPALG